MIKAEYKIVDDETGEVFMTGVATPDEERDIPEIVNYKSNGTHEIVQIGRKEYDFSFTICIFPKRIQQVTIHEDIYLSNKTDRKKEAADGQGQA